MIENKNIFDKIPRMRAATISFRCDEEELKTAKKICRENDIPLTTYLLTAVVHYIHAQVQQGKMEEPEFLRKLSERFGTPN